MGRSNSTGDGKGVYGQLNGRVREKQTIQIVYAIVLHSPSGSEQHKKSRAYIHRRGRVSVLHNSIIAFNPRSVKFFSKYSKARKYVNTKDLGTPPRWRGFLTSPTLMCIGNYRLYYILAKMRLSEIFQDFFHQVQVCVTGRVL